MLAIEGHGVQTASKGLVFDIANNPEPTVKSNIFFPTLSQSKH